ncbi:MAG: glutamate--cysteine ligase [Pseudomonadota bacterium]
MGTAVDQSPVITSREQLVADLERGGKPKDAWRIGTEHEKFGFCLESLKPLAYAGKPGIRHTLEGLAESGWERIEEDGNLIALSNSDGSSVTLEPGGQLELSGAPLSNIHQTCGEVNRHLTAVKAIAEPLGAGFLGMGFHPLATRDDIDWMPKGRYKVMRRYMPQVGTLGIDMMTRTCTVQVNLDFADEADMVLKFRLALALQPLATALFANSPFTEGQPNGYLSYRSQVWTDTDPNRAGMLPFVFESGMGYERWVDYLLDVPMYFVSRGGGYIDAAGQSFRDFLAGKLPALPGELPTVNDWRDHMTTVFPEARLKTFIEMRGADGGPWSRLCALPAFWVGLLYDDTAQNAAWDLVKSFTAEERQQLRNDVPRLGLQAQIQGRPLQELAKEILKIATAGLHARAAHNAAGDDETGFLTPLREIVESGVTPAQRKLDLFHSHWEGDIRHLFEECAY